MWPFKKKKEQKTPPICKNCKHHAGSTLCHRNKEKAGVDLVSGDKTKDYVAYRCKTERENKIFGCTWRGKYFIDKQQFS